MTNAVVISATAATLAGLAGSAHCLAMCGGMAGALGMRARNASGETQLLHVVLYHAGRLTGYSAAGFVCGLAGSALVVLNRGSALVGALRIASGVLMLLIAARIALRWNALGPLERLGAQFWRWLRPLAIKQASSVGARGSLLLGLLWGWLPCALVYSMLLFATLSRSAWVGAAILFAYGIGTLPSMLGATLLGGQLQRLVNRSTWRMATGALLAAFGVWTIVAATISPHNLLYCAVP